MADAAKYPLTVFWSDEDEAFIAEARDLAGCTAVGDTQAEAVAQAQDAIDAWLQAAATTGRTIPAPSTAASETAYSGKFVVRVPRSLHAQLARRAAVEGVSLNQLAVHLLSQQPGLDPQQAKPQQITPYQFASKEAHVTGVLTNTHFQVLHALLGRGDAVQSLMINN
jgi:antitoxin HicB